jgi:GDSL-like Lipase/Acylhydrolase family
MRSITMNARWLLAFLLGISVILNGCRTPAPELRHVQPTSANWEKEIAVFEARDRTNPPPRDGILFIGSSSIRMWSSLEKDFPALPVYNRGFGGSQIIDSVYYANRIVLPYHPRKIVLYAGGNDINAGKSADQVFKDFQLFVATVRQQLPRTEIAYVSIAPNPARWTQIERIREANRLIRDYTQKTPRLSFIDVHSHMLNEQGLPKEGIYLDDKLHMNANGYAIWKEVIGPTLH